MKYLLLILIAASSLCFAATSTDESDLFIASKCVKCHTVESKQIETTSKKDPSEIKDLSMAGETHDAATLTAYLLKETELDGKRHKVKFKGEEADLSKLVAWILTLK